MRDEYYRSQMISALDRLRAQFFHGDEALKLLRVTPQTGETEVAEITSGWGGQRTATATGSGSAEAGTWQFQIAAASDWATSQNFMQQVAALRVGSRRWKVKKIEAPAGIAMVWKIKAEIQ